MDWIATWIACASLATAGDVQEGFQAERRERAATLVLNEVGLGPAYTYVELYNASGAELSLEGWSLESARGTFALAGAPAPLEAGGYLVVARGHASEVGFSVAAGGAGGAGGIGWFVDDPVVAVDRDTLLLLHQGGVVDAVSYGLERDTSARYDLAVAAGQFADGSFVDVSAEFGEVALGRRADALDRDDLGRDWSPHGGADALVGSPMGRNDAMPAGEAFAVKLFQEALQQTMANSYYGTDVLTAAYGGFAGGGLASSALHGFLVSGPDLGEQVLLTGTVSFHCTLLGEGSYELWTAGTLSSPGGDTIELELSQLVERCGSSQRIDALLRPAGAEALPYVEETELLWEGTRGDARLGLSRETTGWTGFTRTTEATTDVDWLFDGGAVTEARFATHLERDWPATDRPAASSDPWLPFTTETIDYAAVATPHASGSVVSFPSYSASYGSYGEAHWLGLTMTQEGDPLAASLVGCTTADVVYQGSTTALEVRGEVVASRGGRLIEWTHDYFDGPSLLDATRGAVDPPADGWRDKLRRGVGWCTRRAMTGVVGAGCALATTVVGGAGGITSVASLGTATPVALGGTALTAGACTVVTAGAYELLAPLDDL